MASLITPRKQTASDDPFEPNLPAQTNPSDDQENTTSRPSSPTKVKRALESQLAETNRRIQDAANLGSALQHQRDQLTASIKQADDQRGMREIDPNLKQKLVDLEREASDLARDQVKTPLLKSRKPSADLRTLTASPHTLTADSVYSPTKPQTKLRSGNDLQLATDISDSLLIQVRNLQNALAEKDLVIKRTAQENADLSTESELLRHKMKSLDDNEQRFKDENWTLETQVQDLSGRVREASEKEQRLTQLLNQIKEERQSTERDFEDLKATHSQLQDDHTVLTKKHETEISSYRKDLSVFDDDRESMQNKIDDLTSQNFEMARAIANRPPVSFAVPQSRDLSTLEEERDGQKTPERSPPGSPVKATPRHGALESETLKTSLTHAHRMIQTLKNNIHREKTEKLELKRMLQDARDEVESSRQTGAIPAAANSSKRRKADSKQGSMRKPGLPSKLGAMKSSDEWEEYDSSPIRQSIEDVDSTDAFETADERQSTSTDTEYHTGAESAADDGSETETERGFGASPSSRSVSHSHRLSFQSTASDEEDDFEDTPQQQRQFTPGSLRRVRESSFASSKGSPASFVSNSSQPRGTQDLAAELAEFDNSSMGSNTPSRSIASRDVSPTLMRKSMPPQDSSPTLERRSLMVSKPVMVDSGMMTDSWEPAATRSLEEGNVLATAATAAAGATIGGIVGRLTGSPKVGRAQSVEQEQSHPSSSTASTEKEVSLVMSALMSQATTPMAPAKPIEKPRPVNADASTVMTPPRITSRATDMTPIKKTDADTAMTPPPAIRDNSTIMTPTVVSKDSSTVMTPPRQTDTSTTMTPVADIDSTMRGASVRARPGSHSSRVSQQSVIGPLPSEQPADAASSPPFTISITRRDGRIYSPDRNRSRQSSITSIPGSPAADSEQRLRVSGEAPSQGQFKEPTIDLTSTPDLRTPPRQVSGSGFTPLSSRSALRGSLASKYGASPANNESLEASTPSIQLSTPLSAAMASKTVTPGSNTGRALSPASETSLSDPNLLKSSTQSPLALSDSSRPRAASPPTVGMPPLPVDHKEIIAAAASRTNSMMSSIIPFSSPPGTGPRQIQQPQIEELRSRHSATSLSQSPLQQRKPMRSHRAPSLAGRSDITRRSSVSSFASELDQRFNIAQAGSYGPGGYDVMAANTDPRMIAAITQTMIGEYLWKYTRKTGRSEHSGTRHRRFFWIHPYTRTLYWSKSDPSVAGRSELQAKSVAIEAVRVVTDNNPMPPGLHPKSIIVVTPGRSIKFTTPTSQRHETWFNALSYLLLRNHPEQTEGADAKPSQLERSNTMTSITSDDINEFDAGWNTSHPTARSNSRRSHRSVGTTASNTVGDRRTYSFNQYGQTPTLTKRVVPSASSRNPPASVSARQSAAAAAASVALRQTVGQQSSPSPSNMNYSNTADYVTPTPTAPDSPHQIDNDGFKKPKMLGRPSKGGADELNAGAGAGVSAISTPARPATSSGRSVVENSPRTEKDNTESGGRLKSLTSRFRPPSFASLSRRGKSNTDIGMTNPSSSALSQSIASERGHRRDGSNASNMSTSKQQQGHERSGSTVENVRACCDGQHDVSQHAAATSSSEKTMGGSTSGRGSRTASLTSRFRR